MRPTVYILCFLLLIGLGSWAYRENYATQAALREVTALQDDISSLRESLAVQRAEWAYLNRPDRLRELVTLNFDRLGLLPMEAHQFGAASDIAYPAPDATLGAKSMPLIDPAILEGSSDITLIPQNTVPANPAAQNIQAQP